MAYVEAKEKEWWHGTGKRRYAAAANITVDHFIPVYMR